ncbi:MAG: glycosyl hydrolase-related protein, partial [Clostridiales bacterium]|nr:glycosyl hydrolase-related protein [Clostridiales bacterium]
KSVPRWVGELYFEFHRGTYTTMGKNKMHNRKTENLLHETEWALTLANAMSLSLEYPKEALDKAWKIVLLNQFHDILPGSSIKEVYDQSWIQYEEAQTILHKELEKAMGAINGCILPPEGGVSALNSSPFPVSETMLADFNPGSDLVDLHGNPVLVQETADGRWALAVRDIPAGSAVVFRHGSGEPANAETVPELKVTEKSLENRFISVMFNANMEISSLIEKSSGVDLADPQKSLCRLVAYDDRPHGDEAWNIQAYYKDISWRTELVSSSVLESGPCRAIIRVSRMYGDSSIIQDFILGVDAKRLDVRFWVDWKQRRCLLKAEFPVPVNASKATFDIQFGNIERSTHNNTLWDFAQFEVCGHKWADMGDSGMGLSLLSESKHGFGAKDGVLSLSLLRGTTHPNESADLGIHEFSLSLYPHSGEWRQAETISQGYAFNCPLRAWTGAGEGKALASSLAASDHANVIIETAKRAEDGNGWIFRIFESHNKKTDFSITFLRALKFARLESLMESGGEELDVNGHALRLSIKPYEILTVRADWI